MFRHQTVKSAFFQANGLFLSPHVGQHPVNAPLNNQWGSVPESGCPDTGHSIASEWVLPILQHYGAVP